MLTQNAVTKACLIPRFRIIIVDLDRLFEKWQGTGIVVAGKLRDTLRIEPFGSRAFVLLGFQSERVKCLHLADSKLEDAFGGYRKIQALPFRGLERRDTDH